MSTNVPSPNTNDNERTPLDVDGVTAVSIGTATFGIGVIACLIFRDDLAASGHSWWVWVCVIGAILGLGGLAFVVRRRAAYRAHRNAQLN